MPIAKRAAAEFLGTFWLVFGGCGSAVLAAAFPQLGIGFAGVALAFGLTVLTMARRRRPYFARALPTRPCRIGLLFGKRFPARGSAAVSIVASRIRSAARSPGSCSTRSRRESLPSSPAASRSNGYGDHSPGGYSLAAASIADDRAWMRSSFLFVIMGATDGRAPVVASQPIAIGLCLTLIRLDIDLGRQHVGQPGSQHRRRAHCRRLGAATTVALLARTDRRRRAGRTRMRRFGKRLLDIIVGDAK